MKYLIILLVFLAVMSGLVASYSLNSAEQTLTQQANGENWMIEKTMKLDLKLSEQGFWRITNDGVMGGKSSGDIVFKADHGVFSGFVSTENNGGFTSVYRPIGRLSQHTDTVFVDFMGDGQPYQLRLALNINGYRINYKQAFDTQVGVRQHLAFPLEKFIATYHGRVISNAPKVSASRIREVGFLINKKVSGEFALQIFSVTFSSSKLLQASGTMAADEGISL
ncbi:CIA30 family protein [Thalassotalea sp. LPB0316]|uniref:CIA30 family protein n=1 Tax=Thalassotalea sp. LPB0316 TaxID=2769490 RepID=UPI0018695AFA|nr:CIA30 family protein [Thalassotalea sp. LPB0316]QOL25136.1 CIA30 family protein [Thalassotalea sp. LPB0316]